MKMLAAEIVSEHGLTAYPDFCEHLLGLDDNSLLSHLESEVERSAFFEAARIKGFVEEAIFSWYADATLSAKGRTVIANAIRSLVTQLSLYRMDDLGAARSRDVLKSFYQALVPEPLRKALGEFYTPDWLVEIACDRTTVTDWLNTRVLDPTCGSGSFLLEVVRRKRLEAKVKKLDAKATLELILESTWGFDLNPLAVQSSRVNYLIAVADLVAEAKAEVELPVLLADAVYSPARSPKKNEDVVEYQIGSTQSDLRVMIPAPLAFDRERLDRVFSGMAECVEVEHSYDEAENYLVKQRCITKNEAQIWRSPLSDTYKQVLDLHKRDWNGIWFRIVRNFFWSAVAGEFDLVVGNPPWVRWSSLPEHYRNRIKPTCAQYAIFSETPFHGGNELDISGMITYTVGDKWLKVGGILVFVITQTHFQSPSSQGFRSFKIDKSTGFLPVEVDDLKKLKPFPKVANKTAIMRLEKASRKKPKYPVPYRVWEKAAGHSGTIPEHASKASVLARVSINEWEATPVAGGNSPWAILPKGRFKDMAAIQGESDWIAGRKGVTCDLNGVLLVRIVDVNEPEGLVKIQTRPEAGRTDIGPARMFWVEPDLLFPLLKGAADFSACHVHIEEELYVFIPNRGINRQDYADAETVVSGLKRTKSYFKAYKHLLRQRSTYKLRQSGAPEYVIYNVGAYTFSAYKVVWAELSSVFEAAVVTQGAVPVIGDRVYVPDHKVYFADFTSENQAHYVCALLNSTLVREYVQSHTIQIQVSNIFKHLKLPTFDAKNTDHKKLATLSQSAHGATSEPKRSAVLAQMDQLAERLLMAFGSGRTGASV
ncbi:N-6 DNA methylase [Azospirillum sp. RWY-5-1]|uniref:site-specific DNA-methyltransferase (adenine-specific) n=1 Tax=Azospirillum oleiclasticum TaxID=2735135 RepID=A0ABX2TBN1_9PROT|nr:N-6 DNA methylase [Azospirillum oleiclasticum]NYZ15374.1 N-6 DNA methylase [Azospirillum oleiclasticum]NYZ21205.1 N-6 DNA methylase [Azospirillum oleiclasticum]